LTAGWVQAHPTDTRVVVARDRRPVVREAGLEASS